VLVDQSGSFAIHGLIPGETYSLTARMRDGGTMFVGQTQATPPSVQVRIRLKEEMNLPSAPGFGQIDSKTPIASKSPKGPAPEPVGDLPPLPGMAPIERDRVIPPPSADRRGPSDGGWSPVRPITDSNELPMPTRPERTAGAPAPGWTPPTADLPSPTAPIAPTIPPPSTPPPTVTRKRSLALIDASGRALNVPNGLPGELVLLDFMTSTCLPCKKAIPELIEFQRRYGANGVEIVGVLCDNVNESERRSLAAKYVKEFNLNYLIHTEAKPGEVQKQFNVKGYPTLVLLDANGDVLWTGHPKDMSKLEEIVRTTLSRR
jgi:thiol-disulfide isomerase/thioredoxin